MPHGDIVPGHACDGAPNRLQRFEVITKMGCPVRRLIIDPFAATHSPRLHALPAIFRDIGTYGGSLWTRHLS
jgi:hypothetical protein